MTMQQNIGGHGYTLDYEKYLAMAADLDLSDDEKRELIDTLWVLMSAFADASFDPNATQKPCGQIATEGKNPTKIAQAMVDLRSDEQNKIGSAFDKASDQCETDKE